MVFKRKKILDRWLDTIGKQFLGGGGPMINTISQKWKIYNQQIDTIGGHWPAWPIVLIDITGIGPSPIMPR